MTTPHADRDLILEDLETLRDWLRYAVTRFSKAGIAFGHGTSSALDEAAFLVLRSLDLPPDQLEPWLAERWSSSPD